MFPTVVAYLLAFVAVGVIAPVLGPLRSPSWTFVRKHKPLSQFVVFLTTTASMFLAMSCFTWAARLIGVAPTFLMFLMFLMFLLPWLGAMDNGVRRIKAARNGYMLTGGRLPDTRDPELQVRVEYADMIGDSVGLWIALGPLDTMPFW